MTSNPNQDGGRYIRFTETYCSHMIISQQQQKKWRQKQREQTPTPVTTDVLESNSEEEEEELSLHPNEIDRLVRPHPSLRNNTTMDSSTVEENNQHDVDTPINTNVNLNTNMQIEGTTTRPRYVEEMFQPARPQRQRQPPPCFGHNTPGCPMGEFPVSWQDP